MVAALSADNPFDLLVIGGGITGCGVALDAGTRGLSVTLVERDDFASGTSSKSSKLIHGGLRYLQRGDVRLVYEALHERQRLLRNAPHLVSVLPFLIPILTTDGPVSKRIAKAFRSALWMYDLTGGVRIGKRHQRVDATEALAHCSTLPADRLSSGFVYYDAQADDARLTLAVARTAVEQGAVCANRCEVIGLVRGDDGRVAGARVECGDRVIDVHARCVVSAAGVWADDIDTFADEHHEPSIRPAKGVHLAIPWELVRNHIAVIIAVPGDKRSLFLIPWGERPDGTYDRCYVGTTDTDYLGDLDDPETNDDDLDYVLSALNHSIRPPIGRPITRDDVTGVWAGLRPLVRTATSSRTADLSRRHRVTVRPDGLISVTGGKLTTYREMASDVVDAAMRSLGRSGRSRTKRLTLWGGEGYRRPPGSRPLDHPAGHLARRYGTHAADVTALVDADPTLGEALVAGLPYLRAEAVYAARHEMATTLADVFARRTRAHLFDREACRTAASDVAALIANELGWTEEQQAENVADYLRMCDAEADAAERPDARHSASLDTAADSAEPERP